MSILHSINLEIIDSDQNPVDLNQLRRIGDFLITGNNISNAPTGINTPFELRVAGNFQIIKNIGDIRELYYRQYTGTWGAWIKYNDPLYFSIPYSELYIGNTEPTAPKLWDSFYNETNDKLFLWNGAEWVEIDWEGRAENDIWYRLNKLRIQNGKLEISNNGTDWYQIYPSIGNVVRIIADDLNPSENYKVAYLSVGQTYLLKNGRRIRCASIEPSLWIGNCVHMYSEDYWFGIRPSGILISNGGITNHEGYDYLNKQFIPLLDGNIYPPNWVNYNIKIYSNQMLALSNGFISASGAYTMAATTASFGSFPSNGYWIGITVHEETEIDVDYFAIRRNA